MKPITKPITFSFGYGDWINTFYHLGVAQCFRDYFKDAFLQSSLYTATSWGVLPAIALVLDLNLNELKLFLVELCTLSGKKYVLLY